MADDQAARVKEANDIVDVVGGYIALRSVGPTFKGLCPFHDDHRPSFDVDPRRQRYRCWSCGKQGDVFSFVMEHEHVDFREALELLARRAGISLEKSVGIRQNPDRAAMLEWMNWATKQFQECLLDSPEADAARRYLGARQFTGETVRRYGLGFAPGDGSWLVRSAAQARAPITLLEKLGLIAERTERTGHYDRFRDRVMFPIRDARGQTVGFGGRILPTSPLADRGPKYYNSAETPLFTKSEQLYGLDQARPAGVAAGFLAVVEGYTDVLMAHQTGIPNVVATLGTALNARHVRNLRRFVPRVVLVFDADQGGEAGVDRALEIFVTQEMELAIATLPEGMDPFDLLVRQGPDPFRQALASAVDALEFKLNRVLASEGGSGSITDRHRAVETILRIMALAPETEGQAGAIRRDLMLSRIAQRLVLREETVRTRLLELRRSDATQKRRSEKVVAPPPREADAALSKGPAAPLEQQLLQILLAEPELVPMAATAVAPEQIEHPGLRRLLEGLVAMQAEGVPFDIDRLRERIDHPGLSETALRFHEIGRLNSDRAAWLQLVLAEFAKRRIEPEKQELQNQLHAACDHTEAVALLRQLQKN